MTNFNDLEKEYKAFYNHLLRNGQILYKDTKMGIWGKAIIEEVHEIFKHIKLEKFSNFIDIGSGDGCVSNIASLFTNSTGIEIDKELLMAGVNIRNKISLNTKFIHGNFEETNLNEYDIVFINPDKAFNRGLQTLFKDYKGTVIIYGELFLPTTMKQIKDLRKNNLNAFIYKN